MHKLFFTIAYAIKPLLIRLIPRKLIFAVRQYLSKSATRRITKINVREPDLSHYKFGINLIADIKAETGLGQSARLLAGLINQTDVPFSVRYYDMKSGADGKEDAWDFLFDDEEKYLINIFHITPCQLEVAFSSLGEEAWHGHYNVAYWLWEMEEFPDEWVYYFNLFDEIWTPSEFISNAVKAKTDKPVRTLPYYLLTPVEHSIGRKYFNLPKDKFLFLMMYDAGSVSERKNPIGVIEAYKKAFPVENPNVGLVLKMKKCDPKEESNIRQRLLGYSNVYFITDSYPKSYVNSLIQSTDVLVSLHRAEGFGLPLAEAMKLGKPVVGTGYSANTEFMNKEVSCIVDYQLINLKHDFFPYKKTDRWAEPDLNQAAGYMIRLYEDEAFRVSIAERGKEYVDEVLGLDRLSASLYSYVDDIKRRVGVNND